MICLVWIRINRYDRDELRSLASTGTVSYVVRTRPLLFQEILKQVQDDSIFRLCPVVGMAG